MCFINVFDNQIKMRFKIKEKQKHSKSVDVSFKSEMDYR